MSEKVVIDGQFNLLTQLIGDPKAMIPADCKEYETGQITFNNVMQYYTINFRLSHNVAPTMVAFYDQAGTYDSAFPSLYAWVYVDHQTMFGSPIYPAQSNALRNTAFIIYKGSGQVFSLSYIFNYANVTKNACLVRAHSTSVVMRPNRTYKWIAIWG